ncbi:TonB-dependent receptor [Terrimonas pollutisoli]|uniref:TonB-dependent receptor n=1 Tax=Terrimonas pollutisoli TaxID=3034147 RepID=UPI0023EB802F|nr:TonB-dependent receptor [Terrimonas sp. H1YJ31]
MMRANRTLVYPTIFLLAFIFLASAVAAQTGTVSGTVKDGNGVPLSGASITVLGSARGTTTNAEGAFSLSLNVGKYTITASFVGYGADKKAVDVAGNTNTALDFVLLESGDEAEVVVTGTRALPRTQLASTAPVDLIDLKKVAADAPQVYVNQILNYVAPSFNSATQTVADGTDHIDPASLRGLGPDQVLVLINGKRRYTTALVNLNGTFGRGAIGTDLNAIPVSAIDRIEILRDGAAAQYGSDAIAGVINIILKNSVNAVTASVTSGANVTKFLDKSVTDGETVQAALNFGIPFGERGGFINFSGSYDFRNYTNRAGDRTGTIYNRYDGRNAAGAVQVVDRTDSFLLANNLTRGDFKQRVGQSRIRSGQFMFNANFPVNDNGTEYYLFGGIGYRNGQAAGNRRLPHIANNVIEIYPLGFLPEIHSDIYDKSLAMGIRGRLKDWHVDFSNTYGQNQFLFRVANSLNASMERTSPTRFNAGGPIFTQNTTNLDFSRQFDELDGINVAFGAEHRFERYQLIAGEESSYTDYGKARQVGVDASGKPILVPDPRGTISTRFGGADSSARGGGAQVFPGYRPENAVNATRSAIAAYADGEFNLSSAFLVNTAARFENYNDFGSTFNGKIAMRYKVGNKFAIRASGSTGFRAPSLHQRYLSVTSTLFVAGVPYEVGTFTNDSRPAELLGIPKLRPEKSRNVSVGFTGNLGRFKVTLDGYFIRINDRIVITDQFQGGTGNAVDIEIARLLALANANRASFFANAINTETKGIDLVVSYNQKFGRGNFRADLTGTLSKTQQVGAIKASPKLAGKENIYFSESNRIFLEESVPRQKAGLTLTYAISKFNFFLRNVYFGEVTEATNIAATQQVYDSKVITDLSVGYKFTKNLRLTIGANNLLDIYPEKTTDVPTTGGNQFIYSRRVTQIGFNGRYLFGRIELNL